MRILFILTFVLFSTTSISNLLKLVPVAQYLPASWAVALMPDGALLISHRQGNLSLVSTIGERIVIDFIPEDLYPDGQGGLLDVKLHPAFDENGFVYISYSAGNAQANSLKIVRGKLVKDADGQYVIKEINNIFEVQDKKDTPVHYSGRMLFDRQNYLYVTSGDGFDYREQAQVNTSQLGKILRMTDEGSAPVDNPFFNGPDSPQSFIFTVGHRNAQGLIVLEDNTIVAHEHGPDGGDEMNIISSGNNYGWPVATTGMDYIGSTISPFSEYPGMQNPEIQWTPSIAPSGMIFYSAKKFASLEDKYLITSLKDRVLYVVDSNFKQVDTLFADMNMRLRDIISDRHGNIYILTDGQDAKLYRVEL